MHIILGYALYPRQCSMFIIVYLLINHSSRWKVDLMFLIVFAGHQRVVMDIREGGDCDGDILCVVYSQLYGTELPQETQQG